MSLDGSECDRRTVLKATAVGVVGTSGLATASTTDCNDPVFEGGDYVVTDGVDGSVTGYDACSDPSYVVEIDNGLCGYVRNRCCNDGEWFYEIEFDGYDELVWIAEPDLAFCKGCDDPAFETDDFVATDGEDGYATGYDACTDPETAVRIDNGFCGYVRDRCCNEGIWLYLVEFEEKNELLWIEESELSYCIS